MNVIINPNDSDSDSDSDSDTDPDMPELESPSDEITYISNLIESDPIFGELNEYERHTLEIFVDSLNDDFISQREIEIIKNDLYNERCAQHKSIDLVKLQNIFISNKIIVIDATLFKEKNTFSTKSYSELNWIYPKRRVLESDIDHIVSLVVDDNLLNTNSSECLTQVDPQSQSAFCELPDELILNIITHSFPYETMDFRTFFNMRYVCKRFYNIVHTNFFIDKLIKCICSSLKERIKKTFVNLDKVEFNFFSRLMYEYIFNLIKNHLIVTYGNNLVKVIGGVDAFMKLPSIYVDSTCIENLCGGECVTTFHSIINFIDSPIVKGVDDKERPFVLFIYQNTTTKKFFFEFVYKNSKPSHLNMTYSGINFDTYIGNKSTNYTCRYSTTYRPLNYKSYDYIERLVKGKDVGAVSYKHNLSEAEEDFSNKIILNYNRKQIIKQILNTFNKIYTDEFSHTYSKVNCFIDRF
jgi:hypothetical protein